MLERSRAEHKEILDATRALIKESKSVEKSKSIEENQLKEKLKTSEIIRDVWVKSFQKITNVRKKLSEERKVNKELLETLKNIQKGKNVLENKLDYAQVKLSKEVIQRTELDRKGRTAD